MLTVLTVAIAAALLWFNSPRRVALVLSTFVAVMGAAFLLTAVRLEPPVWELVRGSLVPRLPDGSALLAVALVGTTVVPYNLFLGSGLARGQRLGELRFGLTVAILLGGLISMGVVVVGASTVYPLEFSRLAEVLAHRLGGWSTHLFAIGLFAAGLTSAVTAPLAAAVTARSVLAQAGDTSRRDDGSRWSPESWRFRGVWIGVLSIGLLFGVSGVSPVPVIILAQALNGILLPVVAVFLLMTVNDSRLMGEQANHLLSNLLMGAIVVVSLFLGLTNVGKAVARSFAREAPGTPTMLWITMIVVTVIAVPLWRSMAKRDSKHEQVVAGGFEG